MLHAASEGPISGPFAGTPIDAEVALAAYRHLVVLRLVSAKMVLLQRREKIATHHTSIGEEGAIVGAAMAARNADWVFPGAREWGAAIVRGLSISEYVHHAFGSAAAAAKGHAAPDYLPGRRVNVAPASGVIGAHVPQAVGAAWAAKIRKDDVATIALFGEGATSTGDFHNALNFAGVFKAPCVFVCRNNGVATSVPASRQTHSESFAGKAVAYGIASARIDGGDVLAVLGLVKGARARAAEGKGPTLLEVVTHPVAELDDAALSGDAVLRACGEHDPIVRLRRGLERERLIDAAADESLLRDVAAAIAAAIAAAEKAGPPDPATIFDDVYAATPPHLAAQKREMFSCRR